MIVCKAKQAPIDLGRDGLMAIAAFRYCLGRRTYIVSDCAEWLVRHWQALPDNVRAVIQRDLETAFRDDDEARADAARDDSWRTLGHDCDRAEWERVRALWSSGGQGVEG